MVLFKFSDFDLGQELSFLHKGKGGICKVYRTHCLSVFSKKGIQKTISSKSFLKCHRAKQECPLFSI